MTQAGLVTVDCDAGSDLLDGTSTNTFQPELNGGVTGNATLRGGGKTDFLDGGCGLDTIVSAGDNTRAFVNGGPDADRWIADLLDSFSSVEDLDF
jgi:hypothetical protein